MPDGEQAASGRAAAGQEYRSRVLDIARAWLPVLTVVIGALWGLYEFIWNERKAAISSTSKESRRRQPVGPGARR